MKSVFLTPKLIAVFVLSLASPHFAFSEDSLFEPEPAANEILEGKVISVNWNSEKKTSCTVTLKQSDGKPTALTANSKSICKKLEDNKDKTISYEVDKEGNVTSAKPKKKG